MKKTNITVEDQLLIDTIEIQLPDFAELVKAEPETIIMHQDAFAADNQPDEYKLLGMAIKYAGLYGKTVIFQGVCYETIKPEVATAQ